MWCNNYYNDNILGSQHSVLGSQHSEWFRELQEALHALSYYASLPGEAALFPCSETPWLTLRSPFSWSRETVYNLGQLCWTPLPLPPMPLNLQHLADLTVPNRRIPIRTHRKNIYRAKIVWKSFYFMPMTWGRAKNKISQFHVELKLSSYMGTSM